MARVYLAKHLVTGGMVAIKALKPESYARPSDVRRFIAEARTVSRLGHPHIVRVEEVVEPSQNNAPPYYVMEYLAGIDLKQELQRCSMPLIRVVHIGVQICEALEAMHGAGITHRDLKPANIFLTRQDGQDDYVKVLDFGLAKLDTPESGVKTTSGYLLGTPAYMSPEQASGKPVDHRSDQYSLGIILYQMLTGRRPFEAESFGEYVVKHLTAIPIKPSELSPPSNPLPEEVDHVILRCLEKTPRQRYPNVGALATDLLRLLPRKTILFSAPLKYSRFPISKRHAKKIMVLAAGGGLAAIALYLIMGNSNNNQDAIVEHGQSSIAMNLDSANTRPHARRVSEVRTFHGQVIVKSDPPGAQVFINKITAQPLGITPCQIEIQAHHPQFLILQKSGYQPVKYQLVVNQRDSISVQIPMYPTAKSRSQPLGEQKSRTALLKKKPMKKNMKDHVRGEHRPSKVGIRSSANQEGQSLDHVTMDPF